jgi:hypothetical protein
MIFKGEVGEIKELMKRSRELGMQTFDQALFDLYEANMVTLEDALRNADSVNDLRLQIKLKSQRARNPDLAAGTEHMQIVGDPAAEMAKLGATDAPPTCGRSRAPRSWHHAGHECSHQDLRIRTRRAASPSSAWA